MCFLQNWSCKISILFWDCQVRKESFFKKHLSGCKRIYNADIINACPVIISGIDFQRDVKCIATGGGTSTAAGGEQLGSGGKS